MLKTLLESRGIKTSDIEFKVVMQMVTNDIKSNRISLGKRTSLEDVLRIAERRRVEIDGTTVYDSVTGETIGDITELSLEEINKLLGGLKDGCDFYVRWD